MSLKSYQSWKKESFVLKNYYWSNVPYPGLVPRSPLLALRRTMPPIPATTLITLAEAFSATSPILSASSGATRRRGMSMMLLSELELSYPSSYVPASMSTVVCGGRSAYSVRGETRSGPTRSALSLLSSLRNSLARKAAEPEDEPLTTLWEWGDKRSGLGPVTGEGEVPNDPASEAEDRDADDALGAKSSPSVAPEADGRKPEGGAGAEHERPGPRGEGLRRAAAERSEPKRKPRSAGNGDGVWGLCGSRCCGGRGGGKRGVNRRRSV